MKVVDNPKRSYWGDLLERPSIAISELDSIVKEVFEDIGQNGDEALKRYTKRFDDVALSTLCITKDELRNAQFDISKELKDAIKLAKQNIEIFHASQKLQKNVITTSEGVQCWQEAHAIEKVGIYIPGGSAPLFSTVLMLGIPAKIAGCKEIILSTPPDKTGNIHPAILYTAKLIGINKVYKLGGIQAIGAFTYGTQSVPRVYKIFGPGNQFVTAAKRFALNEGIAIDMLAGPSELLVLGDDTANPAFVASDLLSQAEHGSDSQVICVSRSKEFLQAVALEIEIQIDTLPRKDLAEKAIENSKLIYLDREKDIKDLINEYAPEHLIIAVANEDYYLENIINAGSVFIGNYTPESAGDYASGTNHTLPTNGSARAYSGVNLDAFVKKITYQKISKMGLKNIGKAIEIMADAEGLQAHKNAITLRLKDLEN